MPGHKRGDGWGMWGPPGMVSTLLPLCRNPQSVSHLTQNTRCSDSVWKLGSRQTCTICTNNLLIDDWSAYKPFTLGPLNTPHLPKNFTVLMSVDKLFSRLRTWLKFYSTSDVIIMFLTSIYVWVTTVLFPPVTQPPPPNNTIQVMRTLTTTTTLIKHPPGDWGGAQQDRDHQHEARPGQAARRQDLPRLWERHGRPGGLLAQVGPVIF